MPKSNGKTFVIDASVARASGGMDAAFPLSKHSRDFLMRLLQSQHAAGFTPSIRAEWNAHQSAFARTWIVQMYARRRVVSSNADPSAVTVEKTIGKSGFSKKRTDAMLKDAHLIAAALIYDKTVVSLDDTVRRLFASCADKWTFTKDIAWLHPSESHDKIAQWLNAGAPLNAEYLLVNFEND